MHDLMKEYQSQLQAAWPELTAQSIADPAGGKFVGAQACKECHSYAYSVWSKTKHAHAYDSLLKGRPGQEATWISRVYDPECLCCHNTGWDPQRALRYESGFIDMQQTPVLAGQQCENCHGPGSRHIDLEKAWKRGAAVTAEQQQGRDAMKLTLTRAKSDVCGRCHDLDNSPHFDFDKYWPKVNHTGRKD
jgi:mono/diheme cytochrome c family protein